MSTKYVYLRGKTKWAMVRKPDEKYGNYKLNLYLNDASQKAFDDSGLQLEPKTDEDGKYYVFRRPHEKMIKKEIVEFGPPKVFNADNTEFDGLVGNGSEITVKVSVYDTMKGKGHRLESLRVEELVEYNPEGSGFDSAGFLPPDKAPGGGGVRVKGERPAVPF